MANAGRKATITFDGLKKGDKVKLSVRQAAFGYQYAYQLRKRYAGRDFKFHPSTREIEEV